MLIVWDVWESRLHCGVNGCLVALARGVSRARPITTYHSVRFYDLYFSFECFLFRVIINLFTGVSILLHLFPWMFECYFPVYLPVYWDITMYDTCFHYFSLVGIYLMYLLIHSTITPFHIICVTGRRKYKGKLGVLRPTNKWDKKLNIQLCPRKGIWNSSNVLLVYLRAGKHWGFMETQQSEWQPLLFILYNIITFSSSFPLTSSLVPFSCVAEMLVIPTFSGLWRLYGAVMMAVLVY